MKERITMRLAAVAFLVACAAAPAAAQDDGPDNIAGRASVIDGDTIEIRGVRVRIGGIDAPESDQTCSRAEGVYLCGNFSAAHLDRLLAGRTVVCRGHDRSYDRIVAACTVAGVDVGSAQVSAGWALDYVRYSKGRYAAAEAEARRAKAGIWQGEFVEPEAWRRARRSGRGSR